MPQFQFLIGRLQTSSPLFWPASRRPFQFLIGRLQTGCVFSVTIYRFVVSIPHRQATNPLYGANASAGGFGFQFLIGRLQTTYKTVSIQLGHLSFNSSQVGYKPNVCGIRSGRQPGEFQFLIGRLQTETSGARIGLSSSVSIPHRQATNRTLAPFPGSECQKFQFLIGRLQTIETARHPRAQFVVSIPHRQATNLLDVRGFGMVLCFNSSQVGYKLPSHADCAQKQLEFQFLIGRLQTHLVITRSAGLLDVSIPHRQATNG